MKNRPRFTVAEKLRAVRLHLEEGFSYTLVAEEYHVNKSSLQLRNRGAICSNSALASR